MIQDEHVDPQDPAKENSPKSASKSAPAALAGGSGDGFCYWNDKKYSDGATVCDARRRYECWNGKWVDVGNC